MNFGCSIINCCKSTIYQILRSFSRYRHVGNELRPTAWFQLHSILGYQCFENTRLNFLSSCIFGPESEILLPLEKSEFLLTNYIKNSKATIKTQNAYKLSFPVSTVCGLTAVFNYIIHYPESKLAIV